MDKQKKIIVAHPFRQHSFRLASVLNEEGMLFSYCTTVYNKEQSLMGIAKKILSGDNKKKAEGRKCVDIEDKQVVLFCELRGYLALFINHYCKIPSLVKAYHRYLFRVFGKKVAQYAVKNNVDAVIMFDTTAAECFKRIKRDRFQIELILDMSAASLDYCKKIYEEDFAHTGFDYYKETQRYLWNKRILSAILEEFAYTDKFIVASEFTRESLIYSGIDASRIFTLPYGIDLPQVDENDRIDKRIRDKKFLLLYVGHVDYRKGIHHLLNVMDRLDKNIFELHIYGVYHKETTLYKEVLKRSNVYLHGFVTPDKLNEIYSSTDLFVFPTTNDGFGMVVLEALANGLPVLCSRNAGARDVIRDGLNGFVFDYDDEAYLQKLIQKCEQNQEMLARMRTHASMSIRDYSWDKYHEGLIRILNEE